MDTSQSSSSPNNKFLINVITSQGGGGHTLVHERYNADWVQHKEVGLVIRSFRNIAQAVEKFLQPENFARYRANVAAHDNRAVFEISDNLQKILATSYKITLPEPLN